MKNKNNIIMITATTLIIAISIISLAFGSKILNIIELKEALFNSETSKY